MPLQVGFAQVTTHLSLEGSAEDIANVVGLDIGANLSNQAGADAISQIFSDFYLSIIAQAYRYEGCTVSYGTGGDPTVVESITGAGDGVGATEAVPPNTSLLIRKVTNFGGRRNRGRMYVPGLGDPQVGNRGELLGTGQADLQVIADQLLTDLDTAGYQMVIIHSNGSTPTLVTGLVVQAQVATQRRRMR